jgi:putative oxidoreductase
MKGNNPALGLFILRVVVGVVFLMHGLGKLIGPPFPGPGMAGWSGMLRDVLHFPVPGLMAWVGMLIEAGGGLALILGIAAAPVGWLLALYMVIAGVTGGHFAAGFDVFHFGDPMRRGYEYNLTLIAASLCIAFGGPGSWALGGSKGRSEPPRMM